MANEKKKRNAAEEEKYVISLQDVSKAYEDGV